MKMINRITAVLLSVMAMFLLLPMQALAAGSIDLGHANSLTVTAAYAQKPISGMKFDAYLISTGDECGELTVNDRYRDFADNLDIRGKNDEAWRQMARVLAREISLDMNLKPSRSAVTDADGVAKFADIPMGLFLIVGGGTEKDGYVYSTTPFFVMLPEQDMSSNTWNYRVVANAKPGREPVKADFEVIKIWKDDCHKDRRPKSITINLICDGGVYDTITLPHNGTWSYTWKNLETNHQWTVTENRENGYQKPDVQQEGNIFIVTNTCNQPAKPTEPGKPTLPQTGQLWWPVPVLIAAGLLFVVIGLIRRRGIADEK